MIIVNISQIHGGLHKKCGGGRNITTSFKHARWYPVPKRGIDNLPDPAHHAPQLYVGIRRSMDQVKIPLSFSLELKAQKDCQRTQLRLWGFYTITSNLYILDEKEEEKGNIWKKLSVSKSEIISQKRQQFSKWVT